MKKILILTLSPLGSNYGGILQAFALQKTVNKMGYKAITHNKEKDFSDIRAYVGKFKRLSISLTGGENSHIDSKMHKALSTYTSSFIKGYMNTTDIHQGKRKPIQNIVQQYDSFIAGSDQVWRAAYVDIPLQMFNFVSHTDNIFSYAASFGKDDLAEYSAELIETSAQLARLFKAISVREGQGIDIVKSQWNLNADQHIDPTLLQSSQTYNKIINKASTYEPDGEIFLYILDRSTVAKKITLKAKSILKKDTFELLPIIYPSRKKLLKNPERYALPPVEQWLRSFRDAKFVVTDSFHGTVFSIIFNKPFIAIGNKERGLARFTSLLETFGLENRLVSSADEVTDELLNQKIDWDAVNAKIKAEQKRSFEYLKKHLGGAGE